MEKAASISYTRFILGEGGTNSRYGRRKGGGGGGKGGGRKNACFLVKS